VGANGNQVGVELVLERLREPVRRARDERVLALDPECPRPLEAAAGAGRRDARDARQPAVERGVAEAADEATA